MVGRLHRPVPADRSKEFFLVALEPDHIDPAALVDRPQSARVEVQGVQGDLLAQGPALPQQVSGGGYLALLLPVVEGLALNLAAGVQHQHYHCLATLVALVDAAAQFLAVNGKPALLRLRKDNALKVKLSGPQIPPGPPGPISGATESGTPHDPPPCPNIGTCAHNVSSCGGGCLTGTRRGCSGAQPLDLSAFCRCWHPRQSRFIGMK